MWLVYVGPVFVRAFSHTTKARMLGELEISCGWQYEHYCCFCFCFVTKHMMGLTASGIQEVEFGMAHYSWLSKLVEVCVGGPMGWQESHIQVF